MKKIIILALLFLCFQIASEAYAATYNSASTSAAPSGIIQEINNLKDRIASKVAQLNLVEKRGIIGTVTDIGGTQLTLSDKDANIRYIDVDELTKFSSPSAKGSFGISDITKGTTIGVLGRYNKDSRRTLARFIDVLILPQVISGEVMTVDADNYLIKVITSDKTQWKIDFETTTKTYVNTKADGTIKSGFSKIKQNERVVVVGFIDQTDTSKIIASRIIRLPELKLNPRISVITPNTGVTPSTGSGIKLMPITK